MAQWRCTKSSEDLVRAMVERGCPSRQAVAPSHTSHKVYRCVARPENDLW